MTAFPQYAKTSNPAVLDVIAQNKALDHEFFEQGMAFAKKHGGEAFYSSRFGATTDIVAIKAEEKPTTGQWKRHPRGGWLPYKNNPVAKDMGGIRLKQNAIPGLPETVESAYNERMQHYIASPRPFVLDGVVFVGFAFVPQDQNYRNEPDPADGGWEEIKASEWHAAREAYNEKVAS